MQLLSVLIRQNDNAGIDLAEKAIKTYLDDPRALAALDALDKELDRRFPEIENPFVILIKSYTDQRRRQLTDAASGLQ